MGGSKGKSVKSKEHEKIFAEAKKLAVVDAEDEWDIDMSEEAVLARRKLQLGGALGNIAAGTTTEYDLYQTARNIIRSDEQQEKLKKFKEIQNRENFGKERLCELIFDASFDKNIGNQLGKQIKQSQIVLQEYGSSPTCQKIIIGKLERIVFRNKIVDSFKDILYAFYDADILLEESICEWYEVPSTEFSSREELDQLREIAFPFIEWLQTVSEEEDD